MSSFFGKMLYIDLTKGIIETRNLPRKWAEQYTGQKGLGTRILVEDFNIDTDPLGPDNRIVLTTSLMAGTIISSTSKLAITAKSPQTGMITDGSVGGHIGAELKYAGFDAVSITGRAESLSYIYIDPDKQTINPVPDLAGTGSFETEQKVKQLVGDKNVKILTIGPAGEQKVPFSCISSERYRQLGRGGIGAVMGSKNLKAIAIRGWLDVMVEDFEGTMRLAEEFHEKDGVTAEDNEIYQYGTPVLVDLAQESGLLPTKNFSEGRFDNYKNLNGEAFKDVRQNKKACFGCGIACGNWVKEGDHQVEGPEFETIVLGGTSLGIGERASVIEFNALCDDYGIDTISTGGTIAYMMEMTEKGFHDFGIMFGDKEKTLQAVKDIATRSGKWAEAAEGTKGLSEKYGHKELAINVKGMELPGYDPRGSYGMGIAYVTAPRGGCHMSAYPIALEAWGDRDPFTFDGKGVLVAKMQNSQFAKFSFGVCDFWPINSETLGKLFEVTFGGSWPKEKVREVGERVFNLQRMFSVMAGFTKNADKLPQRFYKEVLKAGPPADIPMTEEAFDKAMQEYYEYRGWDSLGRPTIKKLQSLGIEKHLIDEYTSRVTL